MNTLDYRVSAVPAPEYRLEPLMEAVRQHLDALEIWQSLRPDMRVTLKPNLLSGYPPEQAVTTHPVLVEAVVRVLQERNIRNITLADSPGGPYSANLLKGVYARSGMEAMAERTGITLNRATGFRTVEREENRLCRAFPLIEPVLDTDFLINLPKLKTHSMTTFSGGVKNLFGCVPGLQKPELHFRFPQTERFGQMLVDLACTVRPGLTLVDAVVGMEGDGPSGGEPRAIGWTFAATNVHALDRALIDLICLPPEAVWTVRHGISGGLCPANRDDLIWLSGGRPEPILDYRHPRSKSLSFGQHVPGFLQKPLEAFEQRFLSPRPVVRQSACIGCGKCAESCAPGAITVQEGKAILRYEKCIRCYCCQEMCPVRAVEIKRMSLLRR